MLGFAASVKWVVDSLIHGHLILFSVVKLTFIFMKNKVTETSVSCAKTENLLQPVSASLRSFSRAVAKNNRIYLKQRAEGARWSMHTPPRIFQLRLPWLQSSECFCGFLPAWVFNLPCGWWHTFFPAGHCSLYLHLTDNGSSRLCYCRLDLFSQTGRKDVF